MMKMFALCSVAAVVSAAKPFTPSQEVCTLVCNAHSGRELRLSDHPVVISRCVQPNLNGEYLLSPTPHASENTMHNSKFPTHCTSLVPPFGGLRGCCHMYGC